MFTTFETNYNSISPILTSIGTGAGTDFLPSGFFPAPQQDKIISDIVEQAGGSGLTYRPILPQALSIADTFAMYQKDWIGSPYQDQFAIPVKVAESKNLAASVSSNGILLKPWTDAARTIWEGATKTVEKINEQLPDILLEKLRDVLIPRTPVPNAKAEIGNSGGAEQHYNDLTSMAANVKTAAGQWFDQVKGLFNLGFPQQGTQLTAPVQTELKAGGLNITTIAIIAGIVLLAIYLFKKR